MRYKFSGQTSGGRIFMMTNLESSFYYSKTILYINKFKKQAKLPVSRHDVEILIFYYEAQVYLFQWKISFTKFYSASLLISNYADFFTFHCSGLASFVHYCKFKDKAQEKISVNFIFLTKFPVYTFYILLFFY